MSFGEWENKRVCDFNDEHPCHSFYRNQNALIKDFELSLKDKVTVPLWLVVPSNLLKIISLPLPTRDLPETFTNEFKLVTTLSGLVG